MSDKYQLHDFDNGKCRGLFDTLADAQAEVQRLGLSDYEIHRGALIVECGDPGITLAGAAAAVMCLMIAVLGIWGAILTTASMIGPLQ